MFIKKSKKSKYKNHVRARQKYQLKRKSKKFSQRRFNGLIKVRNIDRRNLEIRKNPEFIQHPAPSKFTFINNTNEVIDYFITANKYFEANHDVFFDISDVTTLTIDTITLQAAFFGEGYKKRKGRIMGNSPNKPDLKTLFEKSGFYEFVKSSGKKEIDPNNKLFRFAKEGTPNRKFAAEISDFAVEFCYDCIKNNFRLTEIQLRDEIYNILVEAMSNTNHHAAINRGEKKWWIFIQRNHFTGLFSICLIDLGIGIFESANFRNHKKLLSNLYQGNYYLIEDFLDGKVYSSVQDDETRGKGVRQILDCAKRPEIKCLWIITNDVKFEVKSRKKESLRYNFNGTCIYFEIEKMY